MARSKQVRHTVPSDPSMRPRRGLRKRRRAARYGSYYGKHTYPDGGVYDGEWQDNNRHGQGKQTHPGGSEYEGQWQHDSGNGKGRMTFPEGEVVEGVFENGFLVPDSAAAMATSLLQEEQDQLQARENKKARRRRQKAAKKQRKKNGRVQESGPPTEAQPQPEAPTEHELEQIAEVMRTMDMPSAPEQPADLVCPTEHELEQIAEVVRTMDVPPAPEPAPEPATEPATDDGRPLRLSERFGAAGAEPAVDADVSASPEMPAPEPAPEPPADLVCPISQELMTDPVFTADGSTYDRPHIAKWLRTHTTDPVTNASLQSKRLTPNRSMRSMVAEWRQKNGV